MIEMDLLMAAFDQQHIQIMFNSVDGAGKKTPTLCGHMVLMQYVYVMYQRQSLCVMDHKIRNLIKMIRFVWYISIANMMTERRCDFSNPFILKLTELQRTNICVDLAGTCRLTNHS